MSDYYKNVPIDGTDIIVKQIKLSKNEWAFLDSSDKSVSIVLRGKKKQKEHGHTVLDRKGIKNLIHALIDVLDEFESD